MPRLVRQPGDALVAFAQWGRVRTTSNHYAVDHDNVHARLHRPLSLGKSAAIGLRYRIGQSAGQRFQMTKLLMFGNPAA